jgi:glutathione S-transferase
MADVRHSDTHSRILWGAGTPRTLRAVWMLEELDLPYEHRPITSRSGETQTPEYIAINPSRKIPTLQDGSFTLSESAAIVGYLSDAYGAQKGLTRPAGGEERARYDQWCFFMMMELDANTLYIIRRHEDLKEVYGDAPNACNAARLCFEQQAAAAAERLSRSGPYVMGERFGPADILLTTSLTGAERRRIALPALLQDYLARTTARPAFNRALGVNQPAAAHANAAHTNA